MRKLLFSVLSILFVVALTPAASAKPKAPALVEIGAGRANCPAGYVCVWTEPNYTGRGVAVYGTESDWLNWPVELRFMADNAQSIFNNGFLNDSSPDVLITRDANYEGGGFAVCNGDYAADLPLDVNGRFTDNVVYPKSWGNVVSANLWMSVSSCR